MSIKRLPVKVTLKLNRWEEIEWIIVKYYPRYNYIVFKKLGEPRWSWSGYSLNPWQYRTRIIDWEEAKPEHLFDFLTK